MTTGNRDGKGVVNRDSVSGPDEFPGLFFQSCWEIIGVDITRLSAFFCGHTLPKFMTHTNLILLPKKEEVDNFSDMRPISLSSFINKIMVHDRIVEVLPKIISLTQLGFVKGKNITENVLLAQEIIRDIQRRNQHINVVSSRGFKQGDLLSPILFIIAAKVLAKGLDTLHSEKEYKGTSVIKMITVLRDYERVSGQMINKAKSSFYLHDKTPLIVAISMRKLTGIRQGNFPFTYLGCLVFYGRKINNYFKELKEVWDFDHYMILILPFWLNYDESSGYLLLYGVATCPINTARNSGSSHVWRKLLEVREAVEHDIWWQVKSGNSSFWYDSWTKQGASVFTEGERARKEEIELKEYIDNKSWKMENCKNIFQRKC
ncbi:hypothetical protein H5410_031477 [Solanum commersonii]|uniref:Reverse transcriptase domain-containing protein n=1 Tax=Solanum commersonii TaxID=4109 RepID=A0A9J5YHA3_SOLCO|nr:hypothetical protein H5410_031477 [Solanum commersonii]